MKITSPTQEASLIRVEAPPQVEDVTKVHAPPSLPEFTPVADVVQISPQARSQSELRLAGDAGVVDFVKAVEDLVGEGEPNAELKARVIGLIVGFMTDSKLVARRSQQQAAARDAALDAQLEEAQQMAQAEGPPPIPIQQEPAGLRFPSADAYDESGDVLTVAGTLVTGDGAQLPFSANVAVAPSARGDIDIPEAVEQMSVKVRLNFAGDADQVDRRRFRFTVSTGAVAGDGAASGGDSPVGDRLRVWEHTKGGTRLAAVGVEGRGPVVVDGPVLPPTSAAMDSHALDAAAAVAAVTAA